MNSIHRVFYFSLKLFLMPSTPNGNLRFFVKHWHGALGSAYEADTMQIQTQITGQSPNIVTNYADGIFNNKRPDYSPTGWGCLNDATPTLVGTSCDVNHGNDDW